MTITTVHHPITIDPWHRDRFLDGAKVEAVLLTLDHDEAVATGANVITGPAPTDATYVAWRFTAKRA
jgi:hypothetical protein